MSTSFSPARLPATKHSARIGGVRTVYWEAGASETLPVILLHGFGGSHHGLLPLAKQLQPYHLFLPDMPGHGASGIPHEATIAVLAEWFAAYVREVGSHTGQKPVVIAHSFGSQVAFTACQTLRGEYQSCILLTPVPRVRTLPYLFAKTVGMAPNIIAVDVARNRRVRRMRDSYLIARRTPEVIKTVRWAADHSARTPDKAAFNVEISRRMLDTLAYDEAGARRGTFYCISGDTDRMIDAAGTAYLKKAFGEERCFICPHTGHLMPLEAPEETAALIRPLLEI
jgi:pimeloyl-ACP methyl ester carboxylesterase